MKRLILAVITFFIITPTAHSYEFYTFIDQQCRIHSGLITRVDKENFSLWKLNGQVIRLPRNTISGVLIFDTAKNPYSFQKSSSMLRPFLRTIEFGKGKSKESIIGWPYKFVEDLVFYISVENKNYVLSMEQINSIEKLEPSEHIFPSRARTVPVQLNLAPYLPHCFSKKRSQSNYLRPTRTIIDKIKIFVFFENLENGYNSISNFEDRTRVYARPFLYEKRASRFAFLNGFGNKREFNLEGLPLYFERTKGVDFHFQSRTRVGASHQEWLPNVEPLFAATSEIKSHFFNALFIGAIQSLRVGKEGFVKIDKETIEKDTYNVTTSLNYLALMGFDYHKYSFSLGPYHPIYIISTEKTKTQILAGSASPMFRFQYIGEKSRLRMFFSQTKYKPSEIDFSFDSDNDEIYNEEIEPLSFKSYSMRIGFDYQIDSDFTASIDEVASWGQYKQNFSFTKMEDNTQNTGQSKFDFFHLNTTAYLQKDMGDYVFIQLRGNYYIYKYKHNVVGLPEKIYEGDDFKMGVILGFIF